MKRMFDVVVIGAGPAGMSATIGLRLLGLSVLVVDEQPAPGGQIWRAVETVGPSAAGVILGDEYQAGLKVADQFRSCGAVYEPLTQVWKIEPNWMVFLKRNGKAEAVHAKHVVLATGAQERPAPFPGWTLPGVLTVGAAQILLKTSRQIPAGKMWVVGCGPLPLLYMAQLLRAGGSIAGWIDTSPSGGWRKALPWAAAMMKDWAEIGKGLSWLHEIRKAGVKRIRGVSSIKALGDGKLQQLEYVHKGKTVQVDATVLLSHEGVIPSIHMTQSLGCAHSWNDQQSCLAPDLDEWGQTSKPGIYVAGDGAGIGGAKVACVRGEIVALGIGKVEGAITILESDTKADSLRSKIDALLRLRPMLDALYPPRRSILTPSDETIICRCEELTAGEIRRACAIGSPGPNQLKAFTRAGMGPCQGRQCGYTVANIIAEAQQKPFSEMGFYRIRPPLKPITLGEIASLDTDEYMK